jgi:hypothetical protein
MLLIVEDFNFDGDLLISEESFLSVNKKTLYFFIFMPK